MRIKTICLTIAAMVAGFPVAFAQSNLNTIPISQGVNFANYVNVGSFLKCDDVTDDAPALNGLLAQIEAHAGPWAGAGTTGGHEITGQAMLVFPKGAVCKFNESLNFHAEVEGVEANGTIWDFSGMPAGASDGFGGTQDVMVNIGPALFGLAGVTNRTMPYNGLNIVCPAPPAPVFSQGTGVLLQENQVSLYNPVINNCNYDIRIGSNAFLDHIVHPNLFNGTGIFAPYQYPSGGSLVGNAGEQITIEGGSLHDAGRAVWNQNAALLFDGTSFDSENGNPIYNQNGNIRIINGHVEKFSQVPVVNGDPTGTWNSQNNYTYVEIEDTEFYTDQYLSLPLVSNNTGKAASGNGPRAVIRGAALSGFQNTPPNGSWVTGNLPGQAHICGSWTEGNGGAEIPNVGTCP